MKRKAKAKKTARKVTKKAVRKVQPVPKGYHAVTPYLAIQGAMNFLAPPSTGGTPVHIHLYVKDVDATVAKAIEAGAKMVRQVQDMFYGDRSGSIEDPFGHFWHVATHVRDVSMKEMKRAAEEMAKAAGG